MMDSGGNYSSLLNNNGGNIVNNTDNISWYAYRYAESLKFQKDKDRLLLLLHDKGWKKFKKHIYFSLAHICKNTGDKELFSFLLKRIKQEKNKEIKITILRALENMEKAEGLDLSIIRKLLRNKDLMVKWHAITFLQNARDPEIEPWLISLFNETADNRTKEMICVPLSSIGTEYSLSHLSATYNRTRDFQLRNSITSTIQSINNRISSRSLSVA
ncbi:MAG: HEAT repeat domain-containing protein [Cyclobacteriaceae bacterium]